MSNEIFSLPRFAHLLRQYFIARRRELMRYTLTTTVMILFFIICYMGDNPTVSPKSWIFFRTWIYIPFQVIILCLCVALASRSFIDLHTSKGILAETTTPASQLEKFLARWTLGIPLPLLICATIIIALKTIGYTLLFILYGKDNLVTAIGFSECLRIQFSWIIAVTWLQAFFFLGATRRFGAIVIIAAIACLILLTALIWSNDIRFLIITAYRIPTLLILCAIPACCYIASYFIYRRVDINSRS